ncbi:centrosomal protein of 76 kDa-like isoform X1 [Schistocerca serialis cubense]|uniref:centrosomal protein of 76 kDa-like isoform X1 n=1 Tax=Schistocerca serialis cubense TaxID=2023355 RepID=UPI00214E1906|nr:centrosomal protein of 76 kDa-like isoform X1 [Schistocerca serialis cubense]
MELSEEGINVETLRKHIQLHLYEAGIKTHVRELINKLGEQSVDSNRELVAQKILNALQGKGILDDVIKTFSSKKPENFAGGSRKKETREHDVNGTFVLGVKQYALPTTKFHESSSNREVTSSPADNPSDRLGQFRTQLEIEVRSGKAFIDFLLEEQLSLNSSDSWLNIFFYFRGQRRWVKPTICACEPQFSGNFTFELNVPHIGQLLAISDPIHMVLLKVSSSGERRLLSSHFMDWREILVCSQSQKCFMVEFLGVGAENTIPVGTVEVKVSLVPALSQPLSQNVITAQKNLEKSVRTERCKIFLLYAKTWWKDYLSVRSEHSTRTVKIYAQDENLETKPVFTFLKAMEVGRPFLETPRQAAWFVSLIPLENPDASNTLPFNGHWNNLHTFLCCRKGGPADHALLLCSLLLGFGLNAFVCIGTKANGSPWAWVLTQGNKKYVTFWESTTGTRYRHENPCGGKVQPNKKADHNYKTIGSVFNNRQFYASVQESDAVEHCNFNFKNESEWKSMSEAAINSVLEKEPHVPLVGGYLDALQISRNTQNELKKNITEKRMDFNLLTRWDRNLEQYLLQLLASYETARQTGTALVTEDFEEIIDSNIPEDFTFRALPLHVSDIPVRRIFGHCMRHPLIRDIILCKEPDVKLALGVSAYVYPENILSVWLIVACKYRIIKDKNLI